TIKLGHGDHHAADTAGHADTASAPLVAFCHAQGKRVNAEGVDDMEKQSALLQAGCDLFQGYLISPRTS
ncbi:c-di-GMP phosphodiesterase A-related protein, partial [Lacticaseibacillus rhamnosus MTCC 5462]